MLSTIAAVLLCAFSQAQELKSWVNPSSILIGETVEYTLRIKLAPGSRIRYEAFQGFIPGKLKLPNGSLATGQTVEVELLEEFSDSLHKGASYDTWIGKYSITVWDSGTVVLPEQSIVINDSTFYFSSLEVNARFVAPIKDQDIYDIRESFADIPEPQTFLQKTLGFLIANAYWLLPLLAVLVLVIIQLRRHKKAAKSKPKVKEISLKDKTLLAIESLEQQRLWEQGKLKLHYIELSYIMRSYLSSRYNLNLLEKTTLETRLLLRQSGLVDETIDTLMTILTQSDMVKFAKSSPDELSILKVSVLAKQLVAETSPIEFENVD